MRKQIIIVFWLLALAEMISGPANIFVLHYFAKPLLIPVLLLLLAESRTKTPGKTLIYTGLFFSWAGDVLLMFEGRDPLFFIGGLVCFLTTHVCYIIYFLRIQSAEPSLLKTQPWWLPLILAYAVGLVWMLFPFLKEMKLPVMVYAVIISVMLGCSLYVFNKVNRPANYLFVAGAAFFVLSDSLLAINKFYQPFPLAGVCIMLTYCLAQFLIVLGVIGVKVKL